MKSLLKTIVPLACLVLGACAPKAESEKTKARIDEIVAGSKVDVQKIMDATSSGGQPGEVSLSGAFTFSGVFDPRVSLESSTGAGKNGQRPASSNTAVVLHDSVPTTAGFEALSNDTTFINLGCDDISSEGLTKADGDLSKPVAMLRAHTIYICGPQRFTSSMVFIDASKIVLRNVSFTSVGTVGNMFTANAEIVTLEGQNQIATLGTSTYIAGPSLTLSAARIEGSGTLSIKAQGLDYPRK